MIRTIVAAAFAVIAPFTIAQTTTTTTTRETTTTTTAIMALDSTHVLSVTQFAPGDKITVQTAANTQPVTVRLDPGIAYVTESGEAVSPSSIQPGSHVRLEFSGSGPDRMVTRVVFVSAR